MKLKSLIINLLFSFVCTMLNGQYTPMLEEGNFWIYLNHQDADFPSPVSGHAITFQGDTMINSLSYKKVYRHELEGEHDCPPPEQPCWQFDIPYQTKGKELISFIREDTTNKKVFNLPFVSGGFCDTNEHLIFDFSLGVGDTINSCIYEFIGADNTSNPPLGIVDSIKVTERFGKSRNTIFTTGIQVYIGLPPIGEILIFEGVGLEVYGIFHQPLSLLADFCEGGLGSCEILLSNSSIERSHDVNVFPNPTKGSVQISMEKEELKWIRIYSVMGRMIAEFMHVNEVDLSKYEGGIYFFELISENDERVVKKVVKEN